MSKDFYKSGMNCTFSKLTHSEVLDIRSAYQQAKNLRKYISENLTAEALAKRYGQSRQNIEKICGNKTWKEMPWE